MTISSETRKAGPYPGNGVTTAFPFAFKVFTAADLAVTINVIATGVQTTLTLTSDYTVALNPDQNANPGGTVTYNPSSVPMPSTKTLTIGSVVTNTQGYQPTNGGAWLPSNAESAWDRAVVLIQQAAEKVARSLKFPIVDGALNPELPPAAQRANNLLGFDSLGNVTAVAPAAQSASALAINLAESADVTKGATLIGYPGGTLRTYLNQFATSSGALQVGYDNATVAQRLDRALHVEGEQNYRDFWKALSAFNMSEDGHLCIGSYGDSVSADVAMGFTDYWGREFGFVNQTSFTPVELSNALVTPTGTEPAARWPAILLPYTLAGGATYAAYADGSVPDPVYVPNSDQRWIIPVGGSVVWGTGFIQGYQRMLVFLAIEPGAGTCTVDILDQTNAVIATQSINCVNASLGATKADFTGLDTTKTLKLRVTSTAGTVTALGAAFLFRRGVSLLSWRWGGSTFIQQSKSSKAIFDYINNTMGTSIVFVETKGETSFDGIVGGVDGINLAAIRLNALSASKVFIGSRPDDGTEASQYDQIWRFRDCAVTNGYVFVDGYNLLNGYPELQRLVWDRRNNVIETVHLPIITAYYVAGYLISRMPKGFITGLWETRKVFNQKVVSSAYHMRPPDQLNDETQAARWAYPHGLNTPYVKLENISSFKLINSVSAAIAEFQMLGSEVSVDKNIRAPEFVLTGGNLSSGAAAGAASALPATPAQYLRITVNGTNYKIALYA